MATHSIILAWEIPWTEEPCGLQSMRSQKSWTQLSNETTTTRLSNGSKTPKNRQKHNIFESKEKKIAKFVTDSGWPFKYIPHILI